MADHKETTLEDLSREELLDLIRMRAFRLTERDLVFVQWGSAIRRAKAAWDAVISSFEVTRPLAEAVDLAKTASAKIDALAAYRAANEEREKAERRAERLERQADALYQRLQELPR